MATHRATILACGPLSGKIWSGLIDHRFYGDYDYTSTGLKIREAAPLPLGIMLFSYVSAGR